MSKVHVIGGGLAGCEVKSAKSLKNIERSTRTDPEQNGKLQNICAEAVPK
jgi:folate-dependent tRNA-U54 methylase TrmFO/GidA